MKKKLSSLLFMACVFFAVCSSAQTNVVINYTNASDSVSCAVPWEVDFLIAGYASGYGANDSVSIFINFGDGTDSLFFKPANQFTVWFKHWYLMPGAYSQVYIVTGPDGVADTVIKMDDVLVSLTCGNIGGTAFIDNNANCLYEPGEVLLRGIPVKIFRNGVMQGYTVSDTNGIFSYSVPTGFVYDVKIDTGSISPPYNLICPAGSVFTGVTVPTTNLNAAFVCNVTGYDLNGFITGWGFRPGFNAHLWIHANNRGCAAVTGQVKLALDPLLHFISSTPAPDIITSDTLIWNFANLGPLQNFCASVYALTDVTAVIGDSVLAHVIVHPAAGDINPFDNIISQKFPVRNSWDPNMKEVTPAGLIAPATKLTYIVHFQNTGTDTAYNISILDTLDSNLDASTYQLLSASHPTMPLVLNGNVVKFMYNGIMLPDSGTNLPGSCGFVRFSVYPKNSLTHGSEIKNAASIYFDYNPGIKTNTVINTIDDGSGTEENDGTTNLIIYPVPMHSRAVITIDKGFEHGNSFELLLYDFTGRKVKSFHSTGGSQIVINREGIENGLYFFWITGRNTETIWTGKIVIE